MLAVANAHPGVNSNLLNPVDVLDVPSNTHVVNGGPCRVRPSADTTVTANEVKEPGRRW
jgi:hypothetical protein